ALLAVPASEQHLGDARPAAVVLYPLHLTHALLDPELAVVRARHEVEVAPQAARQLRRVRARRHHHVAADGDMVLADKVDDVLDGSREVSEGRQTVLAGPVERAPL